MGHGGNVIDELTTDHREVEELFGRIDSLPLADARRKTLVEQVTIELVRHSIAEEAYVYPAVREYLPDGDAIADKEIKEHATAEQLMKDLEGTEPGEPEFERLVSALTAEIRSHVADEEQNLFPRLRATAGEEKLDELGDQVRRAKSAAPTRPHPSAPDTPPANKLLAPGVGFVDRLRDAITGRGKDD
ncbi:hemerythrin domain-containing protein [Streptomyces sp. 549]|uniref:hemerythrin domain-containing protein n=1 Tax=Streptomyces sp. 549 TaxID=3049076 RepID=UPI0024C237E4|nr:hemerythrin domain-containing protein [Streptomyces sp. 549]MDK1472851.1 hemerythrin domain-containing protein [Streptomyces sp. 549]